MKRGATPFGGGQLLRAGSKRRRSSIPERAIASTNGSPTWRGSSHPGGFRIRGRRGLGKDEIPHPRDLESVWATRAVNAMGFLREPLRFQLLPGAMVSVALPLYVRRLKSGYSQQFGIAEDAVDIQDEGKLLAEFAHPGQIFQTHTCAECGRLFDIFGREIDGLVDGIGHHTHHGTVRVLLDLYDDDAGCLRHRALFESEAHGEIDNGTHVAAQVDDATNPLRHFGHPGDRGVLDDFFYALNVDRVFLIGEEKGQVLLLYDFFFFFDFHEFLRDLDFAE